MTSVRIVGTVALVSIFGSCRTALPRELIAAHPALVAGRMGPVVVEASDAARPSWVGRAERGAVAYVEFVGQASAPAVDTARAEAMRDLLAAVASFVAVEVDSSFSSVETHHDGAESQEVRSEIRTHAQAALRDVHADAFYWERVAASSIDPAQATVRYFVRARVPKAEITRARTAKQAARHRATGRTMVVVTPFEVALDLDGSASSAALAASGAAVAPVARALSEDLGRALAADASLHVVEPSVVDSILGQGTELERLEAVQAALLADFVVSGSVQRRGDALRVRYQVRGPEQSLAGSGVVEGSLEGLFALETTLAIDVRSHLGGEAGRIKHGARAAEPTAVTAAEWSKAERAYAESWAALEAGQGDRAVELAQTAFGLRPAHAPSALRLGRILERLGRFARIEPTAARTAMPSLLVCRDESRQAAAQAVARLRARAASRQGAAGLPPWIEPATPFADAVLQQVEWWLSENGSPAPPVVTRPSAAISAYAEALRVARLAGDLQAAQEALLAIADLAVRVDRIDPAARLYARVHRDAAARGDHHGQSLALQGHGVVLRKRGDHAGAIALLESALVHRAILGEKPYLLEIVNELGGTEVERGGLVAARRWYRQAAQLAEDLGAEYFRAVLANNVGVLAWREGRTADAEEGFAEAYRYLGAHGDVESAVAALLNGAEAAARRGDPEEASQRLAEAQRRIDATDQEGRRAALALRRGTVAAIASGWTAALDLHHEALAMSVALGQSATARREHGAILAAEARMPGATPEVMECLRQAHAWLAAPAVRASSPHVHGSWRARLGEAVVAELALAHDAQVIDALTARGPRLGSFGFERLVGDGVEQAEEVSAVVVVVDRRVSDRRRELGRPERPPPPRRVVEPRDEGVAARESMTGSAQEVTAGVATAEREEASADPPPSAVSPKAAPHERIVGAFETESHALVLLSPRDLGRLGHVPFPSGLVAIAARARAIEARRVEAAARLNLGALFWARGSAPDAYRALSAARRLYAGLGDAEGLAATHEWLGFMLRESEAIDRAAENLALARSLFARLDDAVRAEDVLGWGD